MELKKKYISWGRHIGISDTWNIRQFQMYDYTKSNVILFLFSLNWQQKKREHFWLLKRTKFSHQKHLSYLIILVFQEYIYVIAE